MVILEENLKMIIEAKKETDSHFPTLIVEREVEVKVETSLKQLCVVECNESRFLRHST